MLKMRQIMVTFGTNIMARSGSRATVSQSMRASTLRSKESKEWSSRSDDMYVDDRIYLHRYSNFMTDLYSWSKCVADGSLTVEQLTSDTAFQSVCESLLSNREPLNDNNLLRFLQSLLTIGVKADHKVLCFLENEVLWRTRNMSFKHLLKCLSFHVRFQSTDQQKQVINELILQIQSQLDKVVDDKDIISLIRLSQYFTQECVSRIEDTALQMIADTEKYNNQFGAPLLCYILVLLSQAKRRPTPLIRAVVNRLIAVNNEEIDSISNIYLIKTISALNSLNFPDIQLLVKFCDILCNRNFLDNISSSTFKDLLLAINQLNWCYPRLMDTIIEKITDNFNYSEQDLNQFVLLLARFNYQSIHLNEFLSCYILPNIKKDIIDSYSWLLYVWSLAILDCAKPYHISSVLNNDFCEKVLAGADDNEKLMVKLKLLNLKAVSDIEMNFSLTMPKCLIGETEMPKRQNDLELFRSSLLDSLNAFIPKGKYMSTDILTPFGFKIDAEFIINSSLKPLPISEYGILGGDLRKEIKELPFGYRRIAVLSFGYSDILINSSNLIGVNQLAIRILKKLNYSVLAVNHNFIPIKTPAIKKIQHLQKLLTNLFDTID